MRPDTIIVDLDGTLCDVEHRRHLIRGRYRDYQAFHASCVDDPPNPWCVKLIETFRAAGYFIRIVSGRPRTVERETLEWLRCSLGSLDGMTVELLREPGDHTPDTELKRAWLREQDRGRILFAVDDRRRIVDMWREEGVVCLQCDDWEEREAASKTFDRAAKRPLRAR